ncbi:hypothetical protein GGD83_000120 [Rhodoblastus sphagnicola]|nr:hypothetical protein [Rhodoblastus sphagnicola]MBB4196349.1 hypothetical protein [Rhodoblastus sphagnicola]
MSRLTTLLWVMGGSVLAGALMIMALMVLSLEDQAMRLSPVAAGVGYVIGIPLALIVAWSITPNMGQGQADRAGEPAQGIFRALKVWPAKYSFAQARQSAGARRR